MKSTKKRLFIAYYRVSTRKQENSGAGLEAQKQDVKTQLKKYHDDFSLISEFTEIESGARKKRPELENALQLCKRHKATLIIAKLDRLARNAHFVTGLIESKINFVACDMPQADKTMLQLMAVFAEYERDIISRRIKDALRERKRAGVALGTAGKERARENKAEALKFALKLEPLILEMQADGITKVTHITRELNARNIPTARGGRWHRQTVYDLLGRLGL